MMLNPKSIFLTVALSLMGAASLPSQAARPKDGVKVNFPVMVKEKAYNSINRQTAEAHIGFLASDELRGREAGYESGRVAGNYCASQLMALGIQPWNDSTYFQPFDAYHTERQKRGRWQVHPDSIAALKEQVHQKISLRNVLGKIEGKNPDEIVIIGAHYDHLGVDPLLDGDQIYNGADDNASGVAAVLQIARAFVESGVQPERTVIFALWDGEEKGLLGSEHFVLNFPDLSKIKGYLNFDMIGRNNREDNPEHVVYFYTEAYPVFEQWLRNDIAERGLHLDPDYRAWDRPVGGGDQGSFAKRDIPIIWYHTDWHPDYHQPSDHADRINWDKTVDITRAAFLNLWNLANEKF
ncbi:MAG: M20/M25/M40 family metallo-hydrolase [Clostridium sp.]|nr:M20/M25/M40 family metallo-hydrolase [Clostridium sp.]